MEEIKGIIFEDTDTIGKVKDIRELFVKELANDLLDNDIGIEDKINQINLIQDLLEKIQEEEDNTIIRVGYNPMGEFYYKHLTWEE